MSAALPAVSVIVATLNEETEISGLLDNLAEDPPEEIIVADGGSSDRTVELARPHALVVGCRPGRGIQMNAGAAHASGEVLLFLHADVRLAPQGIAAVRRAMSAPDVSGGNFDIRYCGDDRAAKVFTRVNRWRRRFGVFYGDSGIFCRREVFVALEGYRDWPILEDYDFARRLAGWGRLAPLDHPIHVSDRRWRKSGIVDTLFSWLLIQGLYWLGVSPLRLARLYRQTR